MNPKFEADLAKEILSKIVDNDSKYSQNQKNDLKSIIDTEQDAKKMLDKCLGYMWDTSKDNPIKKD